MGSEMCIRDRDQLKDFEFTLASEPNGYGWKNEINKLIKKKELS